MLAALIYWPGLDSRFLLDDFPNLRELEEVTDYGYRYFIFSNGIAGPSGRPLSLATFALQHSSWPSIPYDFKLVNLILHLCNGVLIYIITLYLSNLLIKEKIRIYFPLLVTSLWLLHPIQLTTVLYVIQRMTLLSTFFTLLGVLSYVLMRLQHKNKQFLYKDCLIGMLVLLFMFLAILSKENGVLLPIYLLSLELTILSNLNKPRYWLPWMLIFLLSPLLVLIFYLTYKFNIHINSFLFRDYSMGQKLLTESIVLFDYIKNIVIPRPLSFGLYHDAYKIISTFYSWKLIFSLALLLTLTVSAFKLRRKQFVYSMAVMWFLGGHLLESTYLNLELYFEHRNYLPSYGILFGISYGMFRFIISIKNMLWPKLGLIIYCGLLVSITLMEVNLWSKPVLQIVEWSRNKPDSIRAKDDLYDLYINHKAFDEAEQVIKELKNLSPYLLHPYINELILKNCFKELAMTDQQWKKLYHVADISRPINLTVVTILDRLTLNIINGQCQGIEIDNTKAFLFHLVNNNQYDNFNRAYFYEYLSSLEIFSGNMKKGLEYLKVSNDMLPKTDKKLREISLLEKMGNINEAEEKRDKLLLDIEKNMTGWIYAPMIEHLDSKSLIR